MFNMKRENVRKVEVSTGKDGMTKKKMADFSVTKVHDKIPMTFQFDHLTISKDA